MRTKWFCEVDAPSVAVVHAPVDAADDLLNQIPNGYATANFAVSAETARNGCKRQRTERWKVMWKRVRESLTWPLRNCFLQLELETSDTPRRHGR